MLACCCLFAEARCPPFRIFVQLRNVCMELRNVCCHPALSDWAERSGSTAATGAEPAADAAGAVAGAAAGGPPAAAAPAPASSAHDEEALGGEHGTRLSADRLVRGSAKLALLDGMLRELHAAGRRVMVLAQSPKALDAVEALARERYCGDAAAAVPAVAGAAAAATAAVAAAFIEPCYERVDATTKTAQRQEAVARFNASCTAGASGSRWLFLQHTRSCGVGTDLPGIDVAVFLDSDWSARKDAQVGRWADSNGRGVVELPQEGDEERARCRASCLSFSAAQQPAAA